MKEKIKSVKTFCVIQLQILQEKKETLRRELLNCKIQEEFLTKTIQDLGGGSDSDR
jgi:hypothetical protein|tara:strand:+ start:944 stop:1111 length:168 start_codon:yes stop_codon:yes gene_type:complete